MNNTVVVKVINESHHDLPAYATVGAAGMDLKANIDEPITVQPFARLLVPTGIRIQLPEGYEAQVRPRSGLALKKGVQAILGTIDSDYTGAIGVIFQNLSDKPYVINDGDRVAQLVVSKYSSVVWQATNSLDKTDRGDGGFGHTGK